MQVTKTKQEKTVEIMINVRENKIKTTKRGDYLDDGRRSLLESWGWGCVMLGDYAFEWSEASVIAL